MSEYIIEVPDYVPPFDPAVRFASLGEEIVRCRDCKSMQRDADYCFCMLAARELESVDGFCAWGERRDA